jgi:hypothetical protein
MKTEKMTGWGIFLIVYALIQCVYMHQVKHQFTLSDGTYEQVGLMEYKDGDQILFTPMYRKLK